MSLVYMGLGMIPLVGLVAGILVMSAMYLAMCDIYINLTNGIKPQVSDLFSQLSNFWPAFKTQFLMIIYIMLWSLLLYVPGLIKGIAYS